MFPFFKAKESGRTISAENTLHVQDIHDAASTLGAMCADGGLGGGGWAYESARIWEAALPMNTSHDMLRGHLRDALGKAHGTTDRYSMDSPYVHDVFPSHVVYSHKGETMKRSYSVDHGAAGSDPKVTLGEPKKVHTAYVDSPSQKECYSVLTDAPADWEETEERFISKKTRDAADEGDFAGKHRSYPILEQGDVEAALKSIGRAGADNHAPDKLKANILRIAKKKGFSLPASDKKESVIITLPTGVDAVVTEAGVFCGVIGDIKEAAKKALESGKPTTIPVKIIQPGWGSMAYYSKEMIQKTGPGTFKKGTQMFWNHATSTQESERPEGDLNDLAAVLTKDAYWDDNGIKGPGLYSDAKVFSDYATQVSEKGPHIGVSINAGIKAHEGEAEGRSGRIADAFVHAFSADFVTKAGAGGAPVVPVVESARVIPAEESIMTEQEQVALKAERDALAAKVHTLEAQNTKILAVATVQAVLKEAGVEVKQSLVDRVCESPKLTSDGKIDSEWARAVATDILEAVGESGGRVTGLGRAKESTETKKESDERYKENLKALGVPEAGLKYAMNGRS